MPLFHARNCSAPVIAGFALIAAALSPTAASAATILKIVHGSGEFRTLQTAIEVSDPVDITFQWTTDEANAASGWWQVKKLNGGNGGGVVLGGTSSPAPQPGHIATFTIPATGAGSFLAGSPPASAVKYSITIEARDASHHTLGSASPADIVTQQKAKPQPAIHFSGRNPRFPTIQLVHYEESLGTVPNTEIWFVNATVTLRAANLGKTKTDTVGVAVNDWNNLWKMVGTGARIDPLRPGKVSKDVKIQLTAQLPPPESQTGQSQQVAEWQKEYKDRCGVDLRAYLTASSTTDQLIDTEQEQYLYLGYGKSKPWEEAHAVTNTDVCDDKQCVHLNDVARSIYKQIACHVVGYAFYVGNTLKHPHAIFDSYGLARTHDNPPALSFGPGTKMQIASASKVITTLAAIKVIGDSNLDSAAFKKFLSSWHVPEDSIVKKITYRDFLAQSSGVKQYNTGPTEGDGDLKAFYTQPTDPAATQDCTGADAKIPIPHPIVSNKGPCYSNSNFSIMRVLIPRFAGESSNDAATLANKYVSLVRKKVFGPVGATNVACKSPSEADKLALPYKWPGTDGADWGDLTTVCGAWGWHVSVEDYAKVLVSLNSADHKILSDCQFLDMQTNPSTHALGWDRTESGGVRWLEKNGADGMGSGNLQTTSVAIYGGSVGTRSHGTCTPGKPGVAGVLFINSQIDGSSAGADSVLWQAFQDATKPKP